MVSLSLRDKNIRRLRDRVFDVLVVGAGINGAASAAALASAGARVALIDKADFGSGSSANSSNFVWGGIKYLESHSYGLVNKLCLSRNRLNRAYPAEIKETRFLATLRKDLRFPAFLMYLGCWAYWLIGRCTFRQPEFLSPKGANRRESIIDIANSKAAVEYSDCHIVDTDTRFVYGFVDRVLSLDGVVVNYVESLVSRYEDGVWVTNACDTQSGDATTIRSRIVVNACGPEVDRYNRAAEQSTSARHVFSKGVHLVVRKLTSEDRILVFFASDGRMFFIAPLGSRSCIGTTDTQVESPANEVTDKDRNFILDNANKMLALDTPLTTHDIISERCGVRPLAVSGDETTADWLQMSRKHVIEMHQNKRYVSIFGGKLTDCLNVGEDVVDVVRTLGVNLQLPQRWYGEPDNGAHDAFFRNVNEFGLDALTDTRASEPLSQRLWRRYGQYAMQIVASIEGQPELARVLFPGSDYTAAELEFAAEHEMITELDDLLRRRSDIAMVVPKDEIARSAEWAYINDTLRAFGANNQFTEYVEIQNG